MQLLVMYVMLGSLIECTFWDDLLPKPDINTMWIDFITKCYQTEAVSQS